MKKILLPLLTLITMSSYAADTYVNTNIDNISTDYAFTKAGLVLHLKNSDYAGCKYVKFNLADFSASSIDINDAREKLNFARSMALSAMMSNKRVQFILKRELDGICTGKGWLKVLSD